ncbi:hypothetical protein [Rhizobium sp. 2MFCol3.1]|uniref:hypothetical protein n=1 Tax=Rhizobium sp. 2MFCol3.1 TaxID=1246459 RepID=UPI00037D9222|nr:hypothetical protein [Rhizobium sp. 2MFCol3.1]
MPKFIACYDLNERNNPHSEFLKAAYDLGWSVWIKDSGGEWNKLPNTTLKGTFTDSDAAVKAFKDIKPAAEKKLGKSITIEKWVVANYSSATLHSDEESKSEPKSN